MATYQPLTSIDADNVFGKTKETLLLKIISVIEVVGRMEALTREVTSATNANIHHDWSGVKERAIGIRETVKKDEMKISVFGSTSVGKSTVINALLGDRILPSGKGTVTQCAIRISAVDGDKGHWISKKEPNEKRDISSLCANATKNSSGIDIYLPKTKHSFLGNNFVMIDSPGIGAKKDLDECIFNDCKDSDVLVLVIDGESSMTLSEKDFFLSVRNKLSTPIICILVNRWDLCENEENVAQIKEQHMESCQELLNSNPSNEFQSKSVFFVSAEKSLKARKQAKVIVSGVHNQDKSDELETFQEIITECLSKNAVATKFYKHIQSGIEICNIIRTEIDNKIKQLGIIRAISLLDETFNKEMQFLQREIKTLVERSLNGINIANLVQNNEPDDGNGEFDAKAYKQTLTQRYLKELEDIVTQTCTEDLEEHISSTLRNLNSCIQRNMNRLQERRSMRFLHPNIMCDSYIDGCQHSLEDYTYNTDFKPNWWKVGFVTLAAASTPLGVTLAAHAVVPVVVSVTAGGGVIGLGSSMGIQRHFWDPKKIARTKFIKNATHKLPSTKQTIIGSVYNECEKKLRRQLEQIKKQFLEELKFGTFVSSTDVAFLDEQIHSLQNERTRANKLCSEFVTFETQVKTIVMKHAR